MTGPDSMHADELKAGQSHGPFVMRRMRIEAGEPLRYFLSLPPAPQRGSDTVNAANAGTTVAPDAHPEIELGTLLGRRMTLSHTGTLRCQACGSHTRKSYSQGHCYPCFKRLASCDLCVMAPHRCHYDKGTCRDPQWGESFCMQPHLVYLANSSGLKVGITRAGQQHGRWRDQGALQGRLLATAATRRAAGELEVQLAKVFGDRSQWRALVTGNADLIDLDAAAAQARALVPKPGEGVAYVDASLDASASSAADVQTYEMHYPVAAWPPTTRLNFKKTDSVSGVLTGMKGQYLLFDTGVFNVREHTSFEVTLDIYPADPISREAVANSASQIDLF